MTAKKKEIKQDEGLGENTQEETLEEKYDRLVGEVKSRLIPNSQLITGGAGVRGKYSNEGSSFTPVLAEINEIGKKLGKPSVGLGHLRG